MNELFKKEYSAADEKLHNKGYYVSNMICNPDCYEVTDGNGNVLIDNLSLAQLCQLAEIL